VEVLDDDADEHVEHEEADEQQERDEVQQAPLAVVPLGLRAHGTTSRCSTRSDGPHRECDLCRLAGNTVGCT